MKAHHCLIQALMWRQCCTESQMKALIAKCVKADSSQSQDLSSTQISNQKMSDFISEVNRNIRAYNMQISRGPNETDGTVFYALINNADNDITRLSTQWTNKEILFFRKLIAVIIESENAFISSTKALNIGREDNIKLSMTDTENLINRLVEQKWLEEIIEGNIAIGVRALLEMNVYIRDQFEVEDCFRCQILCIRGSNCLNCNIKVHFHCADSQFIINNKCPNCSKQWAVSEVFATDETRDSTEGNNSCDTSNESNDSTQDNRPQRAQTPKRAKRR